MSYLYDLYRRDEAPIPLRNTYTGLAETYAKHVGMKEIERQVELWHDEKTQAQIRAFNTAHPVRLDFDPVQDSSDDKESANETQTAA